MAAQPGPGRDAMGSSEGQAIGAALEEVLTRFRGMILHVSHGHALDPSDVDAVMQEVRVRLWQSQVGPETIRGLGASYVYRTATSAAVDILRRRRAARTGVEAVTELPESVAGGDRGAMREMEAHELEERVFAAVGRLPDARRAVVRMYLAGYGRQEIAQALHWNETRVRNLLHRGLVELRGLLEQQGIGPEAAAE